MAMLPYGDWRVVALNDAPVDGTLSFSRERFEVMFCNATTALLVRQPGTLVPARNGAGTFQTERGCMNADETPHISHSWDAAVLPILTQPLAVEATASGYRLSNDRGSLRLEPLRR